MLAPTIKVAEVIENSQRDINIAFVIIFNKLGTCSCWNFLPFKPGLVDPYYLTHKA